jgi:tyrosine-protein phosphatase OCA6
MDFITPLQFAVIEEGLYRGSYPTLRNFCFLERLNIKTIVSLIPEPPTQDLQAFCKLLGIRIIHFQVIEFTFSLLP